ncbi:TonB-dependent receptor [Caulobacter sp. NIBR2454]|uniref:TonB-dependent receptor n=1 Tax=Caulobacter sp. NIBR2454 TaxID=3015996 RepID=UPI0022B5F157|nr:TonB-dependent receptor [Caulobacter sp. NIBR2454]
MKKAHTSLRLGASVTALTVAMIAGQAQAQDTAGADEVEAVVVTGFRSSLDKALNVKRAEAAAVDSILAEDIGKFPDLNLSESIQRIPGVAIARDGGEGRQISVRGLGPQFTRVRINGMEALTTVGSADSSGGTNRGRSFDFNVFASDLFNSITVRKTAEASTEEGSLGATVDLRTARPFDYSGFKIAASALAGYNDLSENVSPRTALMISNTWRDDTFGALISVAYSERKLIEEGASTVRWARGSAFAPGFQSSTAPGITLAQANAAFHPRFPRFDVFNSENKRLGVTGALQWRPTDRTLITFDALYADFDQTREEQYLEAPVFSTSGVNGMGDVDLLSGVINGDNTLISGTFNDVDLRTENRFDKMSTEFTQFTLSGEHELTDKIKLSGVVGHSVSDHKNPIQTTVIFDQLNVDGYSYDFTSRMPTIGYGNANLTTPDAWTLTQIRMRPQFAKNTYDTVQGDVSYQLNETFKFSAGVSWKKYEFETSELRRSNGTTANLETSIPAALAALSRSSFSKVVNLGGTNTVIPDYFAAVNALNLNDPSLFRLGSEPALGNNRGVAEESTGAYVQADFDTLIADMPLRGNFGVRYVETKQDSTGFSSVSGTPVAATAGQKYDDTLPSMNIVFEPRENFLIRFGAAKVMARSDLGSLTPGSTVTVSGNGFAASAGNPALQPFRAKSYDLAFEWYFNRGALLSLALFKKDIETLVQTQQLANVPFSGNPFGLPDSVATAACGSRPATECAATLPIWSFTTPVNTDGADLKGLEINYQQPFTFLPGPLSKMGALLNYTYVKSDVDYVNGQGVVVASGDLTGLSRNSYNATLYYEDSKISARVSAAYRDKYLTRVPGQEAGTSFDGTNETFNVDASVQYTLNDKIKLTLEGVNLTDEYSDQFNDSTNRMTVYHHTGREILVGVRYTF